ncbi:unnamed protein product [Tilletia caries]|nr:unnamed protein product [Tilletia caries]
MRSSRQSGSEREWNFGHLPHNVTERGISIYAASEQDEGFFDGKGDTPPPPLKKRRRSSASSLSSYSGSSSFGSSAHNSSAPVCNSKTSDQPTAAAGLGTLLATLDSAPVTIRGRSRKHFAGAAAASC